MENTTPKVPFKDPLTEQAIDKSTVVATINLSADQLAQDIPEPDFTPPPAGAFADKGPESPFADKNRQFGDQYGGGSSQGGGDKAPPPRPPFNPDLAGVPQQEVNESAEVISNMLLDGYEMAWGLANNLLMISDKKINKELLKGAIDLRVQVPVRDGIVTLGQFIQQYNLSKEDTLTVSPEFRARAQPLLAYVLAKRGIAATPEQTLAALVFMDSGWKTWKLVQGMRGANSAMAFAREMSASANQHTRKNDAPPPEAPKPADSQAQATGQHQPPPPPPPQPAAPQSAVDFNAQIGSQPKAPDFANPEKVIRMQEMQMAQGRPVTPPPPGADTMVATPFTKRQRAAKKPPPTTADKLLEKNKHKNPRKAVRPRRPAPRKMLK